MEEKNHILGPLLVILTVLAIAAGWYLIKGGQLPGIPVKIGSDHPVPVIDAQAEPGKLLPAVPSDIVVVKDGQIKTSFSNKPPGVSNIELTTSIYRTKASVSDLFATYVAYMTEKGYKISRSGTWQGTAIVVGESASTTLTISMYPTSLSEREVQIIESRPTH